MQIGSTRKKSKRKGVLTRQSGRTPADLAMLAAMPAIASGLILAYTIWRQGGPDAVDPMLYLLGAVPIAAAGFLVVRARRNLAQIASVAEAVSIAAELEATETELLVAETDSGPGRAWNKLVKDIIAASSQQYAAESSVEQVTGSELSTIALESINDAIAVINRRGSIIQANSAASTMLADSGAELIGMQLGEFLEGDSLVALDDVLSERIQRRQSVDIVREHGEAHNTEILRFSVVPISGSEEAFAVVVVQDVTRQRHAERSRHDFLAQATHELRTPLTNIRLYVDEAIEAGDSDPKSRAEAINVIASESLRLERIVSELLDISELEAGARGMEQGDVRMDQLLEDLSSDFEALAASKEVSLVFELPPKIPVLQGDRSKLAATLHNLVGNAIKYTPQGGSVVVRAEDGETELKIAVEDSGIGISEEEQEQVCNKFFRSSDPRVSDIEGTGLGLAFAQQVAELHGGTLSLESELNKGSTFTLSMPKPRMAA